MTPSALRCWLLLTTTTRPTDRAFSPFTDSRMARWNPNSSRETWGHQTSGGLNWNWCEEEPGGLLWCSSALSPWGNKVKCLTTGPPCPEQEETPASSSAGWSSAPEPAEETLEPGDTADVIKASLAYLSVSVALWEAPPHHVCDSERLDTQQVQDHGVGQSELGLEDGWFPLSHTETPTHNVRLVYQTFWNIFTCKHFPHRNMKISSVPKQPVLFCFCLTPLSAVLQISNNFSL